MKEVLRLSLPLTVWIIAFCAVYGLQGLACSRHWPLEIDPRTALVFAWGLTIAAQAGVLAFTLAAPLPSRTVQGMTVALAVVGLAAILWTLAPLVFATVCA